MEKQKIISFSGMFLSQFEERLNKELNDDWYLESNYDKNLTIDIEECTKLTKVYGFILMYKVQEIRKDYQPSFHRVE